MPDTTADRAARRAAIAAAGAERGARRALAAHTSMRCQRGQCAPDGCDRGDWCLCECRDPQPQP